MEFRAVKFFWTYW